MLSVHFGIMYNKIFRCTLRRVDSQVRKIRNTTTNNTTVNITNNTNINITNYTTNNTSNNDTDNSGNPITTCTTTFNTTNNTTNYGICNNATNNSTDVENDTDGAARIVGRVLPSNVCICEDVLSTVNELCNALVESKLVIDKLNILVKILQTLSAVRVPIPMGPTTPKDNSCGDKKEDGNTDTTTTAAATDLHTTVNSATSSSTINSGSNMECTSPTSEDESRSPASTTMKSNNGSASTDTDELLESLCTVIQCSMATNDYDDDDADGNDTTVHRTDDGRANSTTNSTANATSTEIRDTISIRNTNKKYTSNIHWLAEFAYMSCSILLRDLDSVSIGPQGYALVTLQQCMHILYGIDIFDIDVSRKETDSNYMTGS